MKPFKECPDETILNIIRTTPTASNTMLASRFRLLGYEDATHHKVRRRKRTLRRLGLLQARLVSSEAKRAEDTDNELQ